MKVTFIAPVCNVSNSSWFSPGRSAKIDQLIEVFSEKKWICNLVNTSPFVDSKELRFAKIYSIFGARYTLARYLGCLLFLLTQISRIRDLKTDIIWVYNSRFCELCVALQLKILNPRSKLVIQVEDINGARSENSAFFNIILDEFIYTVGKVFASKIFFASKSMLASCERSFYSNKYSVFAPAIDDHFIEITSQKPKRFEDKYIKILYAGGYGYDKGVDILIEAVKRVPHAKLILAGNCPDDFKKYNLSTNINIVGIVPKEKLYQLYAEADIVVNPHRIIRRTEGIFPYKTIEHIASRALPLSSNLPSLCEFNFPKYLIFKDPDHLVELLRDSRAIYASHYEDIISLQTDIINTYRRSRISDKIISDLKI